MGGAAGAAAISVINKCVQAQLHLITTWQPHSHTVAQKHRDNQRRTSRSVPPPRRVRPRVCLAAAGSLSQASVRVSVTAREEIPGGLSSQSLERLQKIRSEKVFSSVSSCVGNVRAICFPETAPLHSNFPFNDPHRCVFIKSSVHCESQQVASKCD